MARPKKENAEYFSHDADMRNHRKIRAIGNKFGLSGYGAWCILLEMLTEADYNRLPVDDNFDWVLRTPDFYSITTEEVQEMIKFCLTLHLFQTEKDKGIEYFYSVNLRERLTGVYEKRKRLREKYEEQKTLNIVSATETPISATETTVSDGLIHRNGTEVNSEHGKRQKTGLNTPKNGKNTPHTDTPKRAIKLVSATETPISATETNVSANLSTETPISATETTQSKVKESKVKESKRKETKVSKEVREEEKLPLPFLDKNNKISTADRLSKLQSDGAYLDGLSTLKKIGLHELDILFRCFFEEQVSSGKAYNSDLDARKHFGSWLDATRNNHAGFIDGQIKKEAKRVQSSVSTERANISQKQSSIERANELLKTIKARVDFIEGKVYSSGQEVSNEITGIKQNLLELGKVAESLPEHASKIGQSIEFANSKLNTFEAAIDNYINSSGANGKPKIDNLTQMLANKFGEA